MENFKHQEKNQRVVTFLNREEIDFLDKLGKDALFSTGSKLSRTKLIAWLIDFLKGLNINGENIKSEKDLEDRVLEVLKKIYKKGQCHPAIQPTSHGRLALVAQEGSVQEEKILKTHQPR
jgi:hypothetical protein